MGRLKVLPSQIANMIAAGEVVQRPSSVVKELLENAVDAGASHITVNITDAGRTLIQVIDDGCGMSPADAVLCFERHATSKISSAEDLEGILSYGFRGEALASIAAVSEVTLRTRRECDETGIQVRTGGSAETKTSSVAVPVGSNFSVRNLFFNTPARRKFLKSDNVEFRHIVEEFTRVAVTRPDTAFTLTHNGREIFVLRKEKSLKYRITNLLGSGLADDVVDITAHSSIADISGFIGRPQTAKKTAGNQFFFVNGRFFRSGYLHKAVLNAYENLIPEGTSPSYLIFIETDPHSVDVNIHPTKTEVKFEDEQMLFQLLSASVRETLGRNSFRAGLNFETDKAVEIPQIGRFYDEYRPVEAPGIEFDPDYDPFRAAEGGTAAGDSVQAGREIPSGSWSPAFAARGKAAPADGYGKLFEDRPGAVSRTLIIGGRFVVTPAASGMMVVNIRRATERILYERTLKALSGAREHVSQTTLFPVEIRLGVERRLILDEHADLLARIGFDIKPCGEDSISVEGVPEGYSSSPGDVQSAVEELTDILSQQGDALQEIMNQRLAGKIAASGAAGAEKIGTPLQAQRLIDTLFECDNAEATADGRRTVNIISTEDIDKLF